MSIENSLRARARCAQAHIKVGKLKHPEATVPADKPNHYLEDRARCKRKPSNEAFHVKIVLWSIC